MQLTSHEVNQLAPSFYAKLKDFLESNQKHVKPGETLEAIYYAPGARPINIGWLGFIGYYLIVIHGTDSDGADCVATCHMNSFSMVLRFIPAPPPPATPKPPIGFHGDQGLEKTPDWTTQ